MVNLKTLEAEIKEAEKKKEAEVVEAQIEVYEGQNYEAREAYEQAKQKRATIRSKLPEDIPTDKEYKKQALQAQYIQMRVTSPVQEKQVKEYRAEIKKQQKASKSVQVLDKELPQLYSSAVEEVESVKTGVEKAKQKVEEKYDAVIQTKKETYEKETARRKAQFEKVQSDYEKAVISNPYTDEAGSKRRRELQGRHFSPTRFNYEWAKQSQNYLKRAKETKKEAEAQIRLEHYTKDDFQFAKTGTIQRDASQLLGDISRGKGIGYRNISARGKKQVELVIAKRDLLSGNITEQEYRKRTGQAQTKYKKYEQRQSEMRSAQARVQVAGYLKADSAHWDRVASNPYTSNPNYKTPSFTVGSGTKDDPFRKSYTANQVGIEQKQPPKEMVASWLRDYQDQATKYNKAKTGLETTTFAKDKKDVTSQSLQQIQKQRETELTNRRQQQYVTELRAGNIGQADALLNPQTTQSYTGTSTVNLKTFLKERGYDLDKPEAIPDDVLTKPVKYTEARKQASDSEKFDTPMGDLRFKEPYYAGFGVQDGKMDFRYKYPEASAETQLLRKQAKERIQSFPVINREYNKLYVDPNAPTLPTITKEGAKHNLLEKPQRESQNMMKPNYQYIVYTGKTEEATTVDMYGNKTKTQAPVTEVFDTYEEAQTYQEFLVKSDKKFQAMFTGADNDLINYSYNVRTGVLPEPTTLEEQVKLKLSQVQEPFTNTAKSVNNMLGGKEMQYTETAEEKLISGTIDDIVSGNPFRGTGVSNAWEEIIKDPSRFVVQLPATGVLYYTGGKVISGVTQVTKKGVQLAGQQLDNTIQAGGSLAKPAIIVRGTGQAIDTGVQTVKGAPMKLVQTAYEKVDDYMMKPPTSVTRMYVKQAYGVTKLGVQTIDKKFNYFQDDKVGFGAKAFYVLTPQGKLYVRQVTDIAEDASKNYLKSGKLDVKPVDSDYMIKWTGKDYAEISTPDKVIQITRGQTRIIPKEQGVLANESVLTTGGQKGMIAGGYIGSGGKPFGNYKPFKGTQGTKIIPKEADTLRWRLFKGADIDFRASPRQSSLPRGLVKPMEIDSYTVKGASDSFRDRLPYFGRNRQFKTSIEEISVISKPTPRTVLLESSQNSPKMTSATRPTTVRPPDDKPFQNTPLTSSTGQDIYIPVKNQLTKNIEIRGDALDRLNLKDAKVISTATDKGTPKPYSPYTELVPKEGIPKVKGELVPKEGIPKSKFDNIPYADKKKVTGVLVSTTKNKEIIQEAIESGKIVPIGKRTTLTPEEALKSGSGKQVGDNVFKRIATGQKMDDTQVYQTTREITKVKDFEPTLNISPLGKFKQIDPYGATGVVRGMETITGKPPVKYSKPKPNEEITSFGRSGSTTKQVVRETQSKTPLGKPLQLEDLKSTPKRKYGSEMKSPYSSAVVGSAVVETINDVTEVPPIDRIRDKDETKIGGKLDTGLGIKMDIQGKIDTVLDPRLIQDPTIKQTPNVRSRVRAKAMTGLKLSQAQTVTQIQPSVIPQITFTRRTETSRKKVPPIPPLPELRQRDRKGKRKRGKKAGFIGNVRLDSIVGMYKRQEITYGSKKVRKLERLDMRLTTKTPNRLSTPSSSLLKTRKKKKNKTETILGRTVPKTKDEFSGFKENKSKRKSKKISLL